ncbi:GLPGLI family protein [Aquiflexum sp.]|uniref:GLPGLI family protein n=1 Tax=Aquiflexum sp. TaxID=1872584 RepID=UPI0035935294
MKKTGVFILFCFISQFGFSQTFEAVYSKLLNVEGPANIMEETYKDQRPNIKEEFILLSNPNESYKLTFCNGVSTFLLIPNNTPIDREINFGNVNIRVTKAQKKPTYLIKKFEDNLYFENADIFGREYTIIDSLGFGQWKITKEEKIIGEFKCFKAINKLTDYQVEAWFTSEIPIPDGPWFYSGLPGLIVELKTDKMYFKLEKFKYVNEKIEFESRPTGKSITRKEFERIEHDKAYQLKKMMEEGT